MVTRRGRFYDGSSDERRIKRDTITCAEEVERCSEGLRMVT